MGKNAGWSIAGLVALIIGLFAIYPEKFAVFTENKLMMMIPVLAVFLIIFFIWLRSNTRY